MAKNYAPGTIVSTPLVLSMAVLLLLLAGIVIGTKFQPGNTQSKAATSQLEVLTDDVDADSLENDLLLLDTDPIQQDMEVLNSIK